MNSPNTELDGQTEVAKVFLLAGSYLLGATGYVDDPYNDAGETCSLVTGSVTLQTVDSDTFGILGGISVSNRNASAPFALSYAVTLPSAAFVSVQCSANDSANNADANDVNLWALPVGSRAALNSLTLRTAVARDAPGRPPSDRGRRRRDAHRGSPPMIRPWRCGSRGDPKAADKLLAERPIALMIGMVLDQQVPFERAFSAPYELQQRLGGKLTAKKVADDSIPPSLLEAFTTYRALHRFPGAMAERVQRLCQIVVDEWGGKPERIWETAVERRRARARLKVAAGIRRAEGEDLRGAARQAARPAGRRAGARPPLPTARRARRSRSRTSRAPRRSQRSEHYKRDDEEGGEASLVHVSFSPGAWSLYLCTPIREDLVEFVTACVTRRRGRRPAARQGPRRSRRSSRRRAARAMLPLARRAVRRERPLRRRARRRR